MLYLTSKKMIISKKYIPTKLQQIHNKILFVVVVLQLTCRLLCFCCLRISLLYCVLMSICNKTTK